MENIKSVVTSEFCLTLNGKGGAKPTSLARVPTGKVWIHLDEQNPKSVMWLRQKSKLSELIVDNLLDEDTQPRHFTTKKGLFVVLRGLNMNRDSDVDDMIALRLWIERGRIISISHRRLLTIEKIAEDLQAGYGANTPMEVFIDISESINNNIADTVSCIDDELDDIEDSMIDVKRDSSDLIQSRISDVRHKILSIRRYLGPQRDLFNVLKTMDLPNISGKDKETLREIDRDLIKLVEDLDFAREHATVSQEELDSHTNVQLNQTMYILTIIMVVLAPLTLVTGILGSNSVEISEEPARFLVITGVIVFFGMLQVWYFKAKRWF